MVSVDGHVACAGANVEHKKITLELVPYPGADILRAYPKTKFTEKNVWNYRGFRAFQTVSVTPWLLSN